MQPWWKGAVLYQIYPRSFRDSDGDGVGDLKGIVEGLDHVARLGADGVWISPFFPSPMEDFGYDVSDYRGVDPLFGTLEDFDALLARAHGLGLKVVIDQVYSHTSDRHPWFQESRSARGEARSEWYVWADAKPDGTAPNNWLSVFGGPAWEWDRGRRQYFLHNFLPSQPDLNFHTPAVQSAILDVARFWLDRGVDGFRLDVANYYFHDPSLRDNPPADGIRSQSDQAFFRQRHVFNCSQPQNFAFLKSLRGMLDLYPGRFSVGEIFDDDALERQIEYASGRDRLHSAYSFHLLEATRATPRLFADALTQWSDIDAWPSWSLSNHDVARFPSRLLGADAKPEATKLLLALLLSLRGTIFLYQGDELGLPQADVPAERMRDPHSRRNLNGAGRDGARTPFPWTKNAHGAGFSSGKETWLPIDPRHLELALDRQAQEPNSVYRFVRAFVALRKSHSSLALGEVEVQRADDAVLAFMRAHQGERIVCVFNLSAQPALHPLPQGGRLLASGLSSALAEDGVALPPWGGALALLP